MVFVDVIVGVCFIMFYFQFRAAKAETPANQLFFDLLSLIMALAVIGLATTIASAAYSAQIAGIVSAVGLVVWIAFLLEIVFLLVYLFFMPLVPKKYRKYVNLFN
jgi:glycopeptide antibiotics resistance protein